MLSPNNFNDGGNPDSRRTSMRGHANHIILANPKRLTFGGKVETSGRTPGT